MSLRAWLLRELKVGVSVLSILDREGVREILSDGFVTDAVQIEKSEANSKL